MMNDFDSLPTFTISDVETLKVLSDSLRLDIYLTISELNRKGILATVKQVSDDLNIAQAKLYYHIKLLENHRFIQVADTRIVSGIIEKLYHVTAQQVVIDEGIFSTESGKEAAYPVLSNVVSEVLKKIQSILNYPEYKRQEHSILMAHQYLRLSQEQIARFSEQMGKMMENFKNENKARRADELKDFSFFFVLYPEEVASREENTNDNH